MKSYRKKNHFHTLVISKKKLPFICALLISATVGALGAKFFVSAHGTEYAEFLKLCCACSLSGSTDMWPDVKKEVFSLSVDKVLSHSVPIFTDSASSIPVFNFSGEDVSSSDNPESDDTDADSSPSPAKPVFQKSIVSENLSITNSTDYEIDTSALISSQVIYSSTGEEPKILVMHTHACETYSDENGIGAGENGGYRTVDNSRNVTAIGEIIVQQLTEAGVSAVHDKTLCDSPAYNNSYKKALGLIEWYKHHYPSIEFVFDIHRDAVTDKDSTPVKLIYEKSEIPCAQAMIVCGTDAMGLWHPRWKANLTLGLKIQNSLEKNHPGFMRPLNLRRERFNMHMTPGSLIFEVGTHANTLEEAKNAAMILSEGIIEVVTNQAG